MIRPLILIFLIVTACSTALAQNQVAEAGAFSIRIVGDLPEVQAHPDTYETLPFRDAELSVSKRVELDGTMIAGASSKIDPKLPDEEFQEMIAQIKDKGLEDQIEQLRKDNVNQYSVNVLFKDSGAAKFAKLTKDNVGRKLAFILDGRILSAPEILEPITEGKAAVSVKTEEEMKDLTVRLQELASSKASTPSKN